MTDPDDVTAIALEYALRELVRVAHRHADPDELLKEWFCSVVAVLITGNWPGRSLESLMLLCARRVVSDALEWLPSDVPSDASGTLSSAL